MVATGGRLQSQVGGTGGSIAVHGDGVDGAQELEVCMDACMLFPASPLSVITSVNEGWGSKIVVS